LRGHVLGRIADYERAAELAEQLVRGTTDDGTALLARARTRATFHRFAEALADLDAAKRSGLDRATLEAEQATVLQAIGCYAQAKELHRSAAKRQPDFAMLGALAVLQAERGEVAEAERLFTEARRRYRGTSPFPLASLDFRRGLMWYGDGNLPAARTWFDASRRRVPAYAPAQGHIAEIDTALGAHQAAIDHLRPLASSSDDPGYAARLACALSAAGHHREAEQWRVSAVARYDELALRHPDAFAGHAADFRRQADWLQTQPRDPPGQPARAHPDCAPPRADQQRPSDLVAGSACVYTDHPVGVSQTKSRVHYPVPPLLPEPDLSGGAAGRWTQLVSTPTRGQRHEQRSSRQSCWP
jgi:tetratricopeptide (TPR) repeat protein